MASPEHHSAERRVPGAGEAVERDPTLLHLGDDDDIESMTSAWSPGMKELTHLAIDDNGTITPAHWSAHRAATLRDDLPPEMTALQQGDAPLGFDLLTSRKKLSLGKVLGEGGSGIVYLARQEALAREVAIKVITEQEDDAALAWLLREARVTGALEHPNIVPIHDIGRHEDGRPMIVMRRIEGQGWDRILAEERHALEQGLIESGKDGAALEQAREAAYGELLDKHLRILVQVARAVHFAHAQGILHRDIKPDNVMLGPFGEVYLVDWDIAATFDGDLVPDLPRTEDVDDLFGTPGYMAPEMVACTPADFGPCTDVFMLGTTLYEVLMGKPPYKDQDLVTSLRRSFQAKPPPFKPHIDKAVAEVCLQAMSRKPSARYPSAEDFAEALEDYLKHRHSLALSREGFRKLAELEQALDDADRRLALEEAEHFALEDDEDDDPTVSLEMLDTDERIAQRYRECRFVFQQARNIWPDNLDAYEGMSHATERMVTYELSRDRPDAARALLDDLRIKRQDLVYKVQEALEDKKKREAKLQRVARDRDVHVGQRARGIGAALLSLGSIALNVVCGVVAMQGGTITHLHYGLAQAANLLWALTLVALLRRPLMATTTNRRITLTSVLTIVSYVAIMAVGAQLDLTLNVTLVLMAFVLGIIWLVGTVAFDRRMAALPIIAFVEMPLIRMYEQQAFFIIAVAIGTGLAITAVLLTRDEKRAARRAPAEGPLRR